MTCVWNFRASPAVRPVSRPAEVTLWIFGLNSMATLSKLYMRRVEIQKSSPKWRNSIQRMRNLCAASCLWCIAPCRTFQKLTRRCTNDDNHMFIIIQRIYWGVVLCWKNKLRRARLTEFWTVQKFWWNTYISKRLFAKSLSTMFGPLTPPSWSWTVLRNKDWMISEIHDPLWFRKKKLVPLDEGIPFGIFSMVSSSRTLFSDWRVHKGKSPSQYPWFAPHPLLLVEIDDFTTASRFSFISFSCSRSSMNMSLERRFSSSLLLLMDICSWRGVRPLLNISLSLNHILDDLWHWKSGSCARTAKCYP